MTAGGGHEPEWWRNAVLYHVYLRSYADGDGDGVGDIRGLRERLGHVHDLGVDAVMISPWFRSPMVDGGYDISDHCDVDPLFGTLAEADALIDGAHALGLRVIIDLVANHTSTDHPWFRAAVANGAGSRQRQRYYFRDGRGPERADPPNDWISAFGGSAWSRVTEPDGSPGQWYLHLFAPEQPDVDWTSSEVRDGFVAIMRFWLDRGVDGMRVDAASALAKAPGLPDFGFRPESLFTPETWDGCPFWDTDRVHEALRLLRSVADGYQVPHPLVGEIATSSPRRFADYVRPDELHTAFIIRFAKQPWDATAFRQLVDEVLAALGAVDAPPTWMLGSHDEHRPATRFTSWFASEAGGGSGTPDAADIEVGRRRALAAALLLLALPGAACIYQGEELGLTDIPIDDRLIQDPVFRLTGGRDRGRDSARVPLPWSGRCQPYGFSTSPQTWLPQPPGLADFTVAAQEADSDSALATYRAAIEIRRSFVGTGLTWRTAPDGVLHFSRGEAMECVVNLTQQAHALHGRVLVSSDRGVHSSLPPGTAAWVDPR